MAMSGPAVRLSLPSSSFFKFPPSAQPLAVVPASEEPSFSIPFNVGPNFYHRVLSPQVPVTFAVIYMSLVAFANRINKQRKNKPWSISKTTPFKGFVVLHNLLLAIYSAVTCAALVRALHVSAVSPFLEFGSAAAADSLCKMHGPRGYGDAVAFNSPTLQWASHNLQVHLAQNGLTPEPSDVGRIWNEGLAFWGWLFYLSKFYEVIDTIIILLKGKRSSILQTYHHAGAMLSVWAGIRFMSPPIWMFVLVNSGIHAMMYTYYTLSTLDIRVPGALKRTLTLLQILQMIVGTTYAICHLFISYTIPVPVPVKVLNHTSATLSAGISAASAMANTISRSETVSQLFSSTTNEALPWAKKLALYAAGAPGVANKLPMNEENPPPLEPVKQMPISQQITSYHTSYESMQCLDTDGQVFAIWLNVLYLAPLTGLFVRFFIKSYISRRLADRDSQSPGSRRLSDAAARAASKTSETVERIGEFAEESTAEELSEKAYHGTATPQAEPGEKERVVENEHSPDIKSEPGQDNQEGSIPSDSRDMPSEPSAEPLKSKVEEDVEGPTTQGSAETISDNGQKGNIDEPSLTEDTKAPTTNDPIFDHEDIYAKQDREAEGLAQNGNSSAEQPPRDSESPIVEDREDDRDVVSKDQPSPDESRDHYEENHTAFDEREPMAQSGGRALDGSYDLIDFDKTESLDEKNEIETSQESDPSSKEDKPTQVSTDDEEEEAEASDDSGGQRELLQPKAYGGYPSDDNDDKENIPPQSPTRSGQDDFANVTEDEVISSGEEQNDSHGLSSPPAAEENQTQHHEDVEDVTSHKEDEEHKNGSADLPAQESTAVPGGDAEGGASDSEKAEKETDGRGLEQSGEGLKPDVEEAVGQTSEDELEDKHANDNHKPAGGRSDEQAEEGIDDNGSEKRDEEGTEPRTQDEKDSHEDEDLDASSVLKRPNA